MTTINKLKIEDTNLEAYPLDLSVLEEYNPEDIYFYENIKDNQEYNLNSKNNVLILNKNSNNVQVLGTFNFYMLSEEQTLQEIDKIIKSAAIEEAEYRENNNTPPKVQSVRIKNRINALYKNTRGVQLDNPCYNSDFYDVYSAVIRDHNYDLKSIKPLLKSQPAVELPEEVVDLKSLRCDVDFMNMPTNFRRHYNEQFKKEYEDNGGHSAHIISLEQSPEYYNEYRLYNFSTQEDGLWRFINVNREALELDLAEWLGISVDVVKMLCEYGVLVITGWYVELNTRRLYNKGYRVLVDEADQELSYLNRELSSALYKKKKNEAKEEVIDARRMYEDSTLKVNSEDLEPIVYERGGDYTIYQNPLIKGVYVYKLEQSHYLDLDEEFLEVAGEDDIKEVVRDLMENKKGDYINNAINEVLNVYGEDKVEYNNKNVIQLDYTFNGRGELWTSTYEALVCLY